MYAPVCVPRRDDIDVIVLVLRLVGGKGVLLFIHTNITNCGARGSRVDILQ